MGKVCLQYEQLPDLLFLFSYKVLELKQAVESSISEMNIGKLSLMTTQFFCPTCTYF